MTHTIDGPPSWSIFPYVRIVLKGLSFGPRLFVSFLSQEKIILKGFIEKWIIFGQSYPKSSIKVISEYHDLRDLCFCSWKGFGRFETVSKSWCIPNYQLSVPTKLIIFRCLISEEFKKKVSKSGVSWSIAGEGVIKWFIRFFQIMPLGAPPIFFYPNDSIMKEIVY